MGHDTGYKAYLYIYLVSVIIGVVVMAVLSFFFDASVGWLCFLLIPTLIAPIILYVFGLITVTVIAFGGWSLRKVRRDE